MPHVPLTSVAMTLSIQDEAVIFNCVPDQGSGCIPVCEVIDVTAIPLECKAWIVLMEGL